MDSSQGTAVVLLRCLGDLAEDAGEQRDWPENEITEISIPPWFSPPLQPGPFQDFALTFPPSTPVKSFIISPLCASVICASPVSLKGDIAKIDNDLVDHFSSSSSPTVDDIEITQGGKYTFSGPLAPVMSSGDSVSFYRDQHDKIWLVVVASLRELFDGVMNEIDTANPPWIFGDMVSGKNELWSLFTSTVLSNCKLVFAGVLKRVGGCVRKGESYTSPEPLASFVNGEHGVIHRVGAKCDPGAWVSRGGAFPAAAHTLQEGKEKGRFVNPGSGTAMAHSWRSSHIVSGSNADKGSILVTQSSTQGGGDLEMLDLHKVVRI